MRQSAVSFEVEGLNFEGAVAQPEDGGTGMPGVVICHPHPLHGGNMDNNVVLADSFALVDQGFATLRFNFRGVGNSEGQHTKGELEHQEVLGALEVLRAWPGVNSRRIGLAGYSFGTSVILGSLALHKKAKAFALISPPLRALESTGLMKKDHPVFVIAGDQDKVVQSDKFSPVLDSFAYPPDRHVVPGVDHYWFGDESLMALPVAEFFAKALK